MITIEVWSDIACPFCYIGKKNLDHAIQYVAFDDINIIYKSFELNPTAKIDWEIDNYTYLSDKYAISISEVKKMTKYIEEKAEQVGLIINFDHLIPTNTFDAHRLIHYASQQNKSNEIIELLFDAFFTKSLHIAKQSTLLQLAKKANLDTEQVAMMLESDAFKQAVRTDEQQAKNYGITSIPFFLFNGNASISGAQPTSTFVKVLLGINSINIDEDYNY